MATYYELSAPTLHALDLQCSFPPEACRGRHRPYLEYVMGQWPGRGESPETFLHLLSEIFAHFSAGLDHPSLQSYVDLRMNSISHFYFNDGAPGSIARSISVEDNLLHILGLLTMTREYFVSVAGRQRHIFHLVELQPMSKDVMTYSVPELLRSCAIFPDVPRSSADGSPSQDSTDSTSTCLSPIKPTMSFSYASGDVTPRTSEDGRSRYGHDAFLDSSVDPHMIAHVLDEFEIDPRRLNLFKLSTLAGIKVLWTDNMSRHLLLSRRGHKRYLELFALPCVLSGRTYDFLQHVGVTADYMIEVKTTYANLMSPVTPSYLHRLLDSVFGLRFWCWCLSCSSGRLARQQFKKLSESDMGSRKRRRGGDIEAQHGAGLSANTRSRLPFDPELERLAYEKATMWDLNEFEHLWPRILALDKCLQEAKPWNFWVLLRDNRDTVQYWTFLFGTLILILTILQAMLGLAQVIIALYPGSSE